MNILDSFIQLRDDIKSWVTININALNEKIDSKTLPIDNKLDSSSINPVQNKVITNAISNIPRFSGDYNDLTNAPNITEDGTGNMVIADKSGNIIFKADADGMHTTSLSLNGEAAATEVYVNDAIEEYVENAISNIDFPDTDLSDYYNKEEIDIVINTVKEELSESIVSEQQEFHVVDDEGNIITSIDFNGVTTTAVMAQNIVVNGTNFSGSYNDLTDKPEATDLSNYYTKTEVDEAIGNIDVVIPEETDPTVPAWAKAENPPTYTAKDVGALSDTTVLADLNTDAEHRTVTDAEKQIWNEKSDFSGDYNDLLNAPNITEDGTGDLVIADQSGNIIFRSNSDGFETTQLVTERLVVNSVDVGEALQNLSTESLGVYVQDTEPVDAEDGAIWIDTANDPSFIAPNLPEVTEADNGKVLMVVNGKWQAVTLNITVDENGVLSI